MQRFWQSLQGWVHTAYTRRWARVFLLSNQGLYWVVNKQHHAQDMLGHKAKGGDKQEGVRLNWPKKKKIWKKKTRLRVTPERCPVYIVVYVTSQSHVCRWKAQAMI